MKPRPSSPDFCDRGAWLGQAKLHFFWGQSLRQPRSVYSVRSTPKLSDKPSKPKPKAPTPKTDWYTPYSRCSTLLCATLHYPILLYAALLISPGAVPRPSADSLDSFLCRVSLQTSPLQIMTNEFARKGCARLILIPHSSQLRRAT